MTDANDAAIASAIIAMAKSLNMRVVAEGIENQAQFDFLAQQGCDEGQGYLFSRPISYEHFSHFYKKELLKDIK
jgi:EAL domain-containing protein (putative c-di-GMP-specific phosphodiesterase class I)